MVKQYGHRNGSPDLASIGIDGNLSARSPKYPNLIADDATEVETTDRARLYNIPIFVGRISVTRVDTSRVG